MLTSPVLMRHTLTETSGHNTFLLGILDWLFKIKSKANDGSIFVICYVSSCIIEHILVMCHVDVTKLYIFEFLNQIKASFFKQSVYML